ncbi:MAG: rane protein [Sphingomonas bacterium]|jgi:hypothetical protein|nr:rane protein [Sphingomonas bacterium]
MPTLLIILIIAAMIAAVVMLVRGIAAFLANSTAQVHGEQGEGPSEAALKSNKMMQGRIFFQAIAIFLAAILMLLYGKH